MVNRELGEEHYCGAREGRVRGHAQRERWGWGGPVCAEDAPLR